MVTIKSEDKNMKDFLDCIFESEMICVASIPTIDAAPSFTAINLCKEIYKKGKVLYVTLEVSKKVIEEEILKFDSNVDFNNIKIIDGIDVNIDKIIDVIENDVDIKYIIIDDINCLRTTKSYKDIVCKLKRVALNNKLIIFSFFILHRNVENDIEKRHNKKFILSDIDSAGLNHCDFDKVIFLYRDDIIKCELINI